MEGVGNEIQYSPLTGTTIACHWQVVQKSGDDIAGRVAGLSQARVSQGLCWGGDCGKDSKLLQSVEGTGR